MFGWLNKKKTPLEKACTKEEFPKPRSKKKRYEGVLETTEVACSFVFDDGEIVEKKFKGTFLPHVENFDGEVCGYITTINAEAYLDYFLTQWSKKGFVLFPGNDFRRFGTLKSMKTEETTTKATFQYYSYQPINDWGIEVLPGV